MINIRLTDDEYEQLLELRLVELMDENGDSYGVLLEEDEVETLQDEGVVFVSDPDDEHELRLTAP